MNLLRNKQTYQNPKICYICKEKFENKYIKNRKYFKDRDHCHYTREYIVAVHSICKSKLKKAKKSCKKKNLHIANF